VVQPNLAVVSVARKSIVGARGIEGPPEVVSVARKSIVGARGIEGPPEIVVEILSPSTRGRDEHLERAMYAKFAIPEHWLVEPDLGMVEALPLGALSERDVLRHRARRVSRDGY
jgi:Uma2 family endonuclease